MNLMLINMISLSLVQSGNGAEKAFERVKKMIGIDTFAAELILIDPKTRVNADNDKKIESFCEKIRR